MLSKEARKRLQPFISNSLLPTKGESAETGEVTLLCSLVLLKLEGFDELTEKLAFRNAEEFTSILNDIFGKIIDAAEGFSAEIVSLDAYSALLAIPGTQAVDSLTAISCAEWINRALSEMTIIKTSAGEVHLTARFSVDSGELKDFRVGNKNRLIRVLSGDVADNLYNHIKDAEAGDILISPTAAQGLEEKLKLEKQGSGFKLLELLEAISPLTSKKQAKEAGLQLKKLLPPPLVDRYISLSSDEADSFHQYLYGTVMVVNLKGLPRLFEAYNEYVNKALRIIHKYEGIVKSIEPGEEGDRLIAFFGTPVAHEDDEKRAVLAAKDLINTAPAGVYQRIGVSSGYLFIGVVGKKARKEFLISGQAISEAYFQMQAGEDEEIRIGKKVESKIKPIFAVTAQTPITVGNVSYETYRLESRHIDLGWLNPPQDEFVDRKDELNQLYELLGQVAQTKRGVVATITGEAGVGKSRLLQELAKRAGKAAFTVAGGRCVSYGEKTPYLPWIDFLKGLMAEGEKEVSEAALKRCLDSIERPTWAPLVAPYVGLHLPDNDFTKNIDPSERKQKMFALVLELLAYTSGQNPLLLIFEDIQWIDSLSRDLIMDLIDLFSDFPLLLLMTTRDSAEVLPWHSLPIHSRIDLAPLGADEANALTAARLAPDIPQEAVLNLVYKTTQGNPFFMEEFIKLLETSGALQHQDTKVSLSSEVNFEKIPPTVHRVISSRVDLLNERAKNILRIAAVIGQSFEFSVLNAIQDLAKNEALQRQLSLLEYQGLISRVEEASGDVYQFTNNMIRETLHVSLPASQAKACHQKIAKLLENEGCQAEQVLLDHYSQAEDEGKTLDYLMQSAEGAAAEYANEEALKFYEQVLGLLAGRKGRENLKLRFDTVLKRERIYARLGQRDKQKSDLKALLTLALSLENKTLIGLTLSREAMYHYAVDNYQEALKKGLKAIEILKETDEKREYLSAIRHLTYTFESMGRFDETLKYLEEARTIAEEMENPTIEAQVLGDFGRLFQQRGNYRQSLKFMEEALALYKQSKNPEGEARIAAQLGIAYKYLGLFDKAKNAYNTTLELAVKMGDAKKEEIVLRNLGIIFKNTGNLKEALNYCMRALEIAREIKDISGESALLDTIGNIGRAQGRYEEAIRCLLDAKKIAEDLGNRPQLIKHISNLANVYVELGQDDKALELEELSLSEARELGAYKTEALAMLVIAEIKTRQNKFDEALNLLQGAADIFKKNGVETLYVETLKVLADCYLSKNDLQKAETQADEALILARTKNLPFQTAAALRIQAQIRLTKRDPHAAFFLSNQAVKILKEKDKTDPQILALHAKVLKVLGKADEAKQIIENLYLNLMQKAEKIKDEASRKTFLEQREINREIIEVWQSIQSG